MTRLVPVIRPSAPPRAVLRSLVGGAARSRFAELLRESFGWGNVELYASGRAALSDALRRLECHDRDEVLVPAYTCWSVPAAVVRAGLKVRLVDVDPETGLADGPALERVFADRLAAAILPHLIGRSEQLDGAAHRLRESAPSLFVIEDAAQAWGALSQHADAAILSFARGKPLCLGEGGALLCRKPLAGGAREAVHLGWGTATRLLASRSLSNPAVYRLPDSIPALGIGRTVYDPDFDVEPGIAGWQARLGERLLPSMGDIGARRDANAAVLIEALRTPPGWVVPRMARSDGPLRLPLLAPSDTTRDSFIREMRNAGVVASPLYPGTLADIPGLTAHVVNAAEDLPGASRLAAQLVTLPVYPGIETRDLSRVAEAANRVFSLLRA